MNTRVTLFALVLLICSACSPRIMPPGKSIQSPTIENDRFVMADGAALPLRRWKPGLKFKAPKAVIIALHGFNDYSKSFENAGQFWAARGVLTYAFDQRGFGDAPFPGRWHGANALVDDLAEIAILVKNRHPSTPLFLLGESMGGAVIMAAADANSLPKIDGIILSAPAVWSRSIMPAWQRASLWVFAHAAPGLRISSSGFRRKPSDNIQMLKALSLDPKVIKRTRLDAVHGLVNLMDKALAATPIISGPALILYGRHEDIIPDAARKALEARLPSDNCQIHVKDYGTGYHMLLRDLEARIVWTDIIAWISNSITSLASETSKPQKKLACKPRLP